MQDLEYTPSIYLPIDDTSQKTNLSADLFFELTSTHLKYPVQPLEDITPNLINLDDKIPQKESSKIKTEEFFEEFENNFVVTFEDERLPTSNEDPEKIGNCNEDEEKGDSQLVQQNQAGPISDLMGTNFTFQPQRRRDSLGQTAKIGQSMLHTAPISIEKGSPVSFQVKKRTCFKAKENILSNHHNFKLTKKKIINQDIFQQFTTKSKSCSSTTMPNNSDKLFPTKEQNKNEKKPAKPIEVDFSLESHSYCNFFIDGKQIRERFRSATLNNWKKRFNQQKKTMQQRTAKRQNIFQNVLAIR